MADIHTALDALTLDNAYGPTVVADRVC